MLPNESLEKTALHEPSEETGTTDIFLEQIYSFDDPKRDPRGCVVTIAYYALVAADKLPGWPVWMQRKPVGSRSPSSRRWPSITLRSSSAC